jgi:hypothetical protein
MTCLGRSYPPCSCYGAQSRSPSNDIVYESGFSGVDIDRLELDAMSRLP